MKKTVFKEIIIAMLLCLIFILLLALILYNYVPANKTLPEKISYNTPEKISKELKESNEADEDDVILTYEIDNSDMDNYERINSYNPGKSNPFSSFETQSDGTVVTNPSSSSNGKSAESVSGSTSSNGTTPTVGSSSNSNNNEKNSNNGGEPGYYNYKNGK